MLLGRAAVHGLGEVAAVSWMTMSQALQSKPGLDRMKEDILKA